MPLLLAAAVCAALAASFGHAAAVLAAARAALLAPAMPCGGLLGHCHCGGRVGERAAPHCTMPLLLAVACASLPGHQGAELLPLLLRLPRPRRSLPRWLHARDGPASSLSYSALAAGCSSGGVDGAHRTAALACEASLWRLSRLLPLPWRGELPRRCRLRLPLGRRSPHPTLGRAASAGGDGRFPAHPGDLGQSPLLLLLRLPHWQRSLPRWLRPQLSPAARGTPRLWLEWRRSRRLSPDRCSRFRGLPALCPRRLCRRWRLCTRPCSPWPRRACRCCMRLLAGGAHRAAAQARADACDGRTHTRPSPCCTGPTAAACCSRSA